MSCCHRPSAIASDDCREKYDLTQGHGRVQSRQNYRNALSALSLLLNDASRELSHLAPPPPHRTWKYQFSSFRRESRASLR
mmetsp:Transcript_13400/g.31638  ORF Transcript_13400/g.31638 Transcript_13400/m.31638 type:complete len:81 (+) Transcript_13400:592-834(+)